MDLTSWLDEEGYALWIKNKINMILPLTSLKQAKSVNSTFTRSKAVSSPSISKNIFHLCSCWTKKKNVSSRGIQCYVKIIHCWFVLKTRVVLKLHAHLVDNYFRFLQRFIVKIIFVPFARLSPCKGINYLCLKITTVKIL